MNELKELQEYLLEYQHTSTKCDMDIFKAGVYFLYKEYKVVYVGQAKILAERLVRAGVCVVNVHGVCAEIWMAGVIGGGIRYHLRRESII